MSNPFIKVGEKMKDFIAKVINRDFGKRTSYAKGLYHIIVLYKKYVPDWEKEKIRRSINYKQRLRWT
jgi:hypothetical protein